MARSAVPTVPSMRGFSLVELMVAVVIGMFSVIIMMQVFALSENRKRNTTSGNDAMVDGLMSVYGLQRDVRMAGFGIGDTRVLGCNVLLRAGVTLNALAPLTINHASITGQDANTDTLLVVYGNGYGTPQGDTVIAAANVVQTPSAFTVNDWVVAAPAVRPNPCTLSLQQVANAPVSSVTLRSGVALALGDTLFNLGQNPNIVAYAVRNGALTMCDYMTNNCGDATKNGDSTVWLPITGNLVSLRAQYGRDTTVAMDGIVDLYDQTTATTACAWARISAFRLALVARGTEFNKTATTTTAPVWDGTSAGNPAGSAATPIDLTKKPDGTTNAEWTHYRYKMFQTVVPLRNIAWMGAVAGC